MKEQSWARQLLVVGAALAAGLSVGQVKGQTRLETVEVEGRRDNLLGAAISASEGLIGQREIALRPLLRTGEVLELVPGMGRVEFSSDDFSLHFPRLYHKPFLTRRAAPPTASAPCACGCAC